MNLQEYENHGRSRHEEFAETVAAILDLAIRAEGIPRPQSINSRAKSVESLRKRLHEAGELDASNIEAKRRDLAGVRAVFYTNTDVQRFLNSGIIYSNFVVDDDSVRLHHPTAENEQTRYRAIHYTVRLKEERTNLPEYAKYVGMRCEVQIQTILNHAWSETSHDIIYKNPPSGGFGTKAIESMKRRFDRIMDDYLLPAGYAFQQLQYDYERLSQGRELFDRNILTLLGAAADNNERHDFLTRLREDVLPNYDDIIGVYPDLSEPLVSAVRAARSTPVKDVETTFGTIRGKSARDVATAAIEIVEMLRYVDVPLTFEILRQLFSDENDEDVRQKLLEAARTLSSYDADVWEKVGPGVQLALADALDGLSTDEQDRLWQLMVAAWTPMLTTEVKGTTWKVDSVVLRSGAVPITPDVSALRDRAIAALKRLFTASQSETQTSAVVQSLLQAAHSYTTAEPSSELMKRVLTDSADLAQFFANASNSLSYELIEKLEDGYLHDYRRARDIAATDRFQCRIPAEVLAQNILRFRDRVNADPNFVRYKTLVGYESVFAQQWEEPEPTYEQLDAFRKNEISRFVEEVDSATEGEWFPLINRCAQTQSRDLATFPYFGGFLKDLAARKPETALRLLNSASDRLRLFLTAFLDGFLRSSSPQIYQQVLQLEIADGHRLSSLVRHWRSSNPNAPAEIKAILDRSLELEDADAISECVLFAVCANDLNIVPPSADFFTPAIRYLTARRDPRWVHGAWFAKPPPFLASIATGDAKSLLDNLLFAPRVEHQIERVLIHIAARHPSLVWAFFGERLAFEPTIDDGGDRYQAIPFQFHGLEKELCKDPSLAISIVRTWFETDDRLFRFRGARLLSAVFPSFQPEFAGALAELVSKGGARDTDFALAVAENYQGESPIHDLLKLVVDRFPDDRAKSTAVEISLDSTGVVHGEFGFVEALRQKKLALTSWLQDPRENVRKFATAHLRNLDLRIADEQRRAEQSKALRRLRFEEDKIGDTEEPDEGPQNT